MKQKEQQICYGYMDIKTLTEQMAFCGITQGYLEIRGLSYTAVLNRDMNYGKVNFLRLWFCERYPHFTIDIRYNQGTDLYEIDAVKHNKPIDTLKGKSSLETIGNFKEVFCEDFKRIFDLIFLEVSK